MAVWNSTNLSYISEKQRLDPEFFQKEYEILDEHIGNGVPISKLSNTVDLQSNGAFKVIFEILNDREPKVIPYIRSGNVGDFFLNKEELHRISQNAHKLLPKTHTCKNDILMARKGKIGGATLISEHEEGYNSNDNVVNIRLTDQRFLPGCFVAFWNSKYGLQQIKRLSTGNVQPWLSMKQIRMLKTVLLPMNAQEAIVAIVKSARQKMDISKSLYVRSQKLLEQELGLDKLKFEKSVGYETSFNEVVEANRVDAQCYKPDFVNYEKYLKQNGKYTVLKALIPSMVKGKQMTTVSSGPLLYVSIKDIEGIELQSDSYCLPTKETQIATRGDLLLAITGATIGKIGIVNKYEKLAFSGDLLKLKTNNDINLYYLLTVMQSPIGQSQCNRWVTGSTNGHLAPKDVGKIVIPRLDKKEEERIGKKIPKSLKLKKQSKQFLEKAKKMVEDLIEQAAGEP